MDVDVESAGSTTFKREDLARGFEPDECFYFQGIEHARGKENVGLDAGDPLPDLVFKVDLTSPSLDKLPIFAQVGVAEVCRCAGGRMEMFGLRREELRYETIAESIVLPPLTSAVLARFVEEGLKTRRPAWVTQRTRMGSQPSNSASAQWRLVHPEVPSVSAMASGTTPQPSLVARLSRA